MWAATAWPLVVLAARIAIVSSSSEAGGQATLHYAQRDEERMSAVLAELGSFAAADIWRLPGATASSLRAALDQAEQRAAREPGSAIVIYYSGHADGEGLLLGAERFTYRELRERLARSKAQVRVAILDACNSGSATRSKGGRPAADGSTTTLDPVRVNGAAILAASRAEEAAQESSDIAGSYFTHYLISGLRGAGDRDGDGVVTLAEAYAYVYTHTLAATMPSLWGPQHASYDYQLSGTGDLVLTTLDRGLQGLTFAPAAEGGYTVLDPDREVVAEVRPDPKRRARLALPVGHYRVAWRKGGRVSTTELHLASGVDVAIDQAKFEEVDPRYAFAKGGEPRARNGLFVDYALVGRGLATAGVSSELGLTFRRNGPAWSLGSRFSYGETNPEELGPRFQLRRFTGGANLSRRITAGLIDLNVGANASLTYLLQEQPRHMTALVPGLAAALALEIPMARWFALRIVWDAGFELIPIDGALQARPEIRAALGFGGGR